MSTTIKQEEFRPLIPHAGNMCLLEEVVEWDEQGIRCLSHSHTSKDNPLRNDDGLPMSALIEYGAQAMAVHGGLKARQHGKTIQQGYLASLRNVSIADGFASDCDGNLVISAREQMASAGNMIYEFTVEHDKRVLVSGRATVIAIFDELEKD